MSEPAGPPTRRRELHELAHDFAVALVGAVRPVLPRGFRAKVHFVVDNGILRPEDVTVELRAKQSPNPMK